MSEAADRVRIRDVESAARSVLAQLGAPLHERATIAALESEGVRDIDAARIAPGCADVFALGRLVHVRCLEIASSEPSEVARQARRPAAPGWRRLARRYRRGASYYLPMVGQGAALAILGVSIWGSAGLTPAVQTAIGLAFVLSLIGTAPATQALTQRLYYYHYQGDLAAMERTAARWIGATAVGGLAVGLVAALALAGDWSDAALAFCLFAALQPSMWIANAALFVLGRSWVAALAVLGPTFPVWLALRQGYGALGAHAAGLALADLALAASAILLLRRRARGSVPARRPLAAGPLAVTVGGYAAWGLVYFALMFTDRLVAWTSGSSIAFDPRYEAVLQVGLVPLLLILPALEHVLVRFGELLDRAGAERDSSGAQVSRERAARMLASLVARSTAAYLVCAAATWLVVEHWSGALPLGAGGLVGDERGGFALLVALAGYGCFVAALGVGSAYQLLQRPWPLVTAGAAGVVADAVVGLLARSADRPEHAVFGLLAGGVVFLGTLVAIAARDRRELAFHWFASA